MASTEATGGSMPIILSPSDAFGREKLRGLVMSLLSGVAANALNLFGTRVLGLSVQVSSAIFLQAVGNVLGYTLDILFAKSVFTVQRGGARVEGHVPYGDLATRVRWLLRSFVGRQFFRFLITVIIDTLVSLALLNWAIRAMDRHAVLTEFRYRNVIAAGAIAVGTFFLYSNILRFDWAYSDADVPVFNVIVLMWVTLVLVITAVTYPSPSPEGAPSPSPAEFANKYTPALRFSSVSS